MIHRVNIGMGARLAVDESMSMSISTANDIILPGEMRARYLSINDQNAEARTHWLGRVFHFIEEFVYSENDTRFVSAAETDYDVLVIGGNDATRVAAIYKKNRQILQRRLVVGLMKGSNPHRRARVIFSGLDDVLDIERTEPAEAIARIRAMRLRYAMREVQQRMEASSRSTLAAVAEVDRLSPKERALLEILVERKGTHASHARLCAVGSRTHDQLSEKNLKVSISTLRRKLKPGVRIEARPQQGYALLVASGSPAQS